jgi:hypothetical protein
MQDIPYEIEELILRGLLTEEPWLYGTLTTTCRSWWHMCVNNRNTVCRVPYRLARSGYLSMLQWKGIKCYGDWLEMMKGAVEGNYMHIFTYGFCIDGFCVHWFLVDKAMQKAAKHGRIDMLLFAENFLKTDPQCFLPGTLEQYEADVAELYHLSEDPLLPKVLLSFLLRKSICLHTYLYIFFFRRLIYLH